MDSLKGTIHHDAVTQALVGDTIDELNRNEMMGRWMMSDAVAELLTTSGVPVPSHRVRPHDHGGHKILERHLYLSVYPGSMPDVPTAVAFAKEPKFRELRAQHPRFTELWNERLTVKDWGRYRQETWPATTTITQLLLWDSGHYATPEFIASLYLSYPSLERIYLGSIIPPETQQRQSSAYPTFYQLTYLPFGELKYTPEGDDAGSYIQPLVAHNHLHPQTHTVQAGTSHVTYYSEPVVAKFAHVLIATSRSLPKVIPAQYHVNSPSLIVVPQPWLTNLAKSNSSRGEVLIPSEAYSKAFWYKRGLAKDQPKDMVSKIRSQMTAARFASIDDATWEILRMSVDCVTAPGLQSPFLSGFTHITIGALIKPWLVRARLDKPASPLWILRKTIDKILNYFLPGWLSLPMHLLELGYALADSDTTEDILFAIGSSLLASLFPTVNLVVFGLVCGHAAVCWYLRMKDAKIRFLINDVLDNLVSWSFTRRSTYTLVEPLALVAQLPTVRPTPAGPSVSLTPTATCPLQCSTCPATRPPSIVLPAVTSGSPVDQHDLTPVIQVEATSECAPSLVHDWVARLAPDAPPSEASFSDSGLTYVTDLPAPPKATTTSTRRPRLQFGTFSDVGLGETSIPTFTPTAGSVAFHHRPSGLTPPESERGAGPDDLATHEGINIPPSVSTVTINNGPSGEHHQATPAPADQSMRTSNPHLLCACEEHDGGVSREMYGEHWVTCVSGFGHWCQDETEGMVPCHVCAPAPTNVPRASGQLNMPIGASFGLGPTLVHSLYSPALRFSPGPVPSNPPNTCALTMVSVLLQVSSTVIWHSVCDTIGSQITTDLLPSPGFDERFLHYIGLRWKVAFRLFNVPKGCPNLVGFKGPRTFECELTRLHGVPHWQPHVRSSPSASPKGLPPSRPLAKLTQSFKDGVDSYISDHGAKIPGRWVDVPADPARAKALIRNLKQGFEGLMKSNEGKIFVKDFTAKLDSLMDELETRPPPTYQLRNIFGVAGSGKSDALLKFLRDRKDFHGKGVWKCSCPRAFLRAAIAEKLKLGRNGYQVSTWEKIFIVQGNVLVIDEHGLTVSGLTDLLVFLNPHLRTVITTGDVCQCKYNATHKESTLNGLSKEIVHHAAYGGDYLMDTHRSPQAIAHKLGLRTTSPIVGKIFQPNNLSKDYPVLVATDAEASVLRGQEYQAFTISSYQGQEAEVVQIRVCQKMLELCDMSTLYSAATRATRELRIVPASRTAIQTTMLGHPFFKVLLAKDGSQLHFETVFQQELRGLNLVRLSTREFNAIVTKRVTSTRASGQWTPSYDRAPATLAVRLEHIEVVPTPLAHRPDQHEPATLNFSTRLPAPDLEFTLETLEFAKLLNRDDLELNTRDGSTEVFIESELKQARTGLWFQRQSPKDSNLMVATIKKRLAKGTESENRADYTSHKADVLSLALFEAGRDFLKWEYTPFDEELFEQCIFENENKALYSKTINALRNNAPRADPDRPLELLNHFLKAQLKGKMEAFLVPAKAGQTLATCHSQILLTLGAANRYLRHQTSKTRPPKIFIHCGTTTEDLNDWAKTHWRDGLSTTNDYTAFDSTQKGASVRLWVSKAELYDLPSWIIELYVWWKLSSVSDIIGPKAVGRETGEPGTYDDNTDYNACCIALKYDLLPTDAVALGGDDSAVDRALTVRPAYAKIEKYVDTVAKTFILPEAGFCSFRLTSRGVYKDPMIIMLKLLVHLERGTVDLVLESYALEILSAYRFGDDLWEYANFDELCALKWILNFYHEFAPALATRFFSLSSSRPGLLQLFRSLRSLLAARVEVSPTGPVTSKLAGQVRNLVQRLFSSHENSERLLLGHSPEDVLRISIGL